MTPSTTSRWMSLWLLHQLGPACRSKFHIVESSVWPSFANFEGSSPVTGCKPPWTITRPDKLLPRKQNGRPQKLHARIIPEGFLESGGTILAPLNIPGLMHWMLGTLKMKKSDSTREKIIRVCTFNSRHSDREAYDAATASVLANTCEHVLSNRDNELLAKNPDAPSPPVRKYLLHRRYCDEQSPNMCPFFTTANMLMHFLNKDDDHIVDQDFTEKLRAYYMLLAFQIRQQKHHELLRQQTQQEQQKKDCSVDDSNT